MYVQLLLERWRAYYTKMRGDMYTRTIKHAHMLCKVARLATSIYACMYGQLLLERGGALQYKKALTCTDVQLNMHIHYAKLQKLTN